MCRLYGFRATEPTRLECALVRAQNSLVVQSRGGVYGMNFNPSAGAWSMPELNSPWGYAGATVRTSAGFRTPR